MATGHSVILQPRHPLAFTLRLTPELQAALLETHKNGTSLKFRAEEDRKGAVKVGVRGRLGWQIACVAADGADAATLPPCRGS